MMELSPDQARAADAVNAWLKSRDKPYFVLQGPAGTGKSTIAKKIAEQHNGPVFYMTFTGRASQVLRRMGTPSQTIHSYIYLPVSERKDETAALEAELLNCTDAKKERKLRSRLEDLYSPEFVLRPTSPFPSNALIVADEMGMIGPKEANDLLSFKIPILALGDPAQLPPIEGKGFFNKQCDFLLTEVHRQAQDSPVLRLATLARLGKPLPRGFTGTSQVINKRDITPEMARDLEIFAVGRNATKDRFNAEIRQQRGFTKQFPQKGDKLMCLRNNKLLSIFNGQTFECTADAEESGEFLRLKLNDGETDYTLMAHPECFTKPEVVKSWSYDRRKRANEFDFGNAATVHKLQGGGFVDGLVYPDLFQWDKEKYRQLLYTGISRFIDKVIVAL